MRDEVFGAVARRVPYLSVSDVTDGDDWVSCAALVANPAPTVRNTMVALGTADVAVAASLFTEAYAFRVAGVALVAYALDLPVPDVAPRAVAVRTDKPRPPAVAYLAPELHDTNAPQLAHDLVGAHFEPFVAAIHDEFTVGERLLWGNVAAACAVAFLAIGDSARARANAEEFIRAAQPWFAETGSFKERLARSEYQGWYWDRTSCCLWFQTAEAGGQYCDNCTVRPDAER